MTAGPGLPRMSSAVAGSVSGGLLTSLHGEPLDDAASACLSQLATLPLLPVPAANPPQRPTPLLVLLVLL